MCFLFRLDLSLHADVGKKIWNFDFGNQTRPRRVVRVEMSRRVGCAAPAGRACTYGTPGYCAYVMYGPEFIAGPCHGWVGARRALVDEKLAR